MVKWRHIRAFRHNEEGTSLLEALLVFPILLMVFAALIEFGFAVFQWNQAVKAVQLGARLAAVSDPLPVDMSALRADYPPEEGGPTPPGPVVVECGAGASACDSARLNRLVFGSDETCDPNYGTSLPGMCDFNPQIRPRNIRISYHRSGLGYVGRPWGPVVTVTLELDGLHFKLPFMGALLGVNTMNIPAHPVTVTSEDLCSSTSCSP